MENGIIIYFKCTSSLSYIRDRLLRIGGQGVRYLLFPFSPGRRGQGLRGVAE